jgi:hypothetical protein
MLFASACTADTFFIKASWFINSTRVTLHRFSYRPENQKLDASLLERVV